MGGGGKGGGGGSDDAAEASRELARIAEKYFKQTDPARKAMLGNWQTFLQGGYDPTASPLYDPGKQAIESQYGVARENLLSSFPRGGGMTSAMTGLESGRASSLGGLASQIAQDEYNKMYGAAFGAPQTSFSGLSGAALGGAQATAAQGSYLSGIGDIFEGLSGFSGFKP